MVMSRRASSWPKKLIIRPTIHRTRLSRPLAPPTLFRRPMKPAITLFTLAAALFIALAANRVLEQQQELQAAHPIAGKIVSGEVKAVTAKNAIGRETTVYVPWVRYRFPLGGGIRSDMRVFPGEQLKSMSEARARQVVADFPAGKDVTVWYVPPREPPKSANPFDVGGSPEKSRTAGDRAFLVRNWSFEPYLIILLSMIHLSVGMALWASRPWQRNKLWPPKPPDSGNWHEISPRVPLVTRRHPWRAVWLAWYTIGGVAIGHYFLHADRPYATLAYVASAIYLLVGLFPVSRWLYHRRLPRVVRDAKIFTNTDTFRPGKTFNVRVEQPFRRPGHVQSVRVALICDRHRGRPSKAQRAELERHPDPAPEWSEVTTDQETGPNRPLIAKTKLTPPADAPPSTPARERSYPRVTWRIAVEILIAGLPPYREDYPITVVSS